LSFPWLKQYNKLTGGYGYSRTGNGYSGKVKNKQDDFTAEYADRLRRAQIECYDALKIIQSRDTDDAFFYLDPPYVGTDQGHYDGYTQEDFDALLSLLAKIKGKFLLSSYRNKALAAFTKRYKWHTRELKMYKPMTPGHKKVEVLTANYPIKDPVVVTAGKPVKEGQRTLKRV
jgi:DNA adenine methylase